jgi:hypothetical protein
MAEPLEPQGSLRDYGIAAPHGPNMETDRHVATQDISKMNLMEESVFNSILKPDDMFDSTGTYWADLPLRQRVGFVNGVNNTEAKRELSSIWQMMKLDPLRPVGVYFRDMVIPGAGLGLEGYVYFYSTQFAL